MYDRYLSKTLKYTFNYGLAASTVPMCRECKVSTRFLGCLSDLLFHAHKTMDAVPAATQSRQICRSEHPPHRWLPSPSSWILHPERCTPSPLQACTSRTWLPSLPPAIHHNRVNSGGLDHTRGSKPIPPQNVFVDISMTVKNSM